MACAAPLDRNRPHREPCKRPAVFDAEGVVRTGKQFGRRRASPGKLLLALCREGKTRPAAAGERKRVQGVRRLKEKRNIRVFRAERQRVAADFVQQRDRALREPLGGAERRRERQLEHEVRAAAHRHFRAGVLVQQRKIAALHEIAAHRADDHRVLSEHFARPLDMKPVPAVKRVVFCNDAADRGRKVHRITIKCARKCAIQ